MKDNRTGMSVFTQVVEAKTFSAAADKIGSSKALVSRSVSALERSLSVKLLNRSTRKLSLTEAGTIFYEHCAKIVQEAELARQHVTQVQSEPAGLVRVTAAPAFAARHLLPALTDFHRQHPGIQVRLSCANRSFDLADAGFDIAIRGSFDPSPNLVARKLAVSRLVLCASPAYLEQHGSPRRVEDLRKHDCILFPPLAPKGVWTFRRNDRKQSVKIPVTLETDDMEAVRSAILAGMGVGVLPSHMAGEDLRRGELVPLLRRFRIGAEGGIYLVYLPNRTLPSRVRALIDFLVAWFEPTPSWEAGW